MDNLSGDRTEKKGTHQTLKDLTKKKSDTISFLSCEDLQKWISKK